MLELRISRRSRPVLPQPDARQRERREAIRHGLHDRSRISGLRRAHARHAALCAYAAALALWRVSQSLAQAIFPCFTRSGALGSLSKRYCRTKISASRARPGAAQSVSAPIRQEGGLARDRPSALFPIHDSTWDRGAFVAAIYGADAVIPISNNQRSSIFHLTAHQQHRR